MRKGPIAIGLAALLAAGAAYATHEEPAFGMYVCPSCYGFEEISERLYIDTGMTEAETGAARADVAEASARVAEFWGSFERKPLMFFCGTQACDTRINYRGAKAKAFGSSFILVYSRGGTATFLAHEFSHIELFARLGVRKAVSGSVPSWFNEGLAVLVSRDFRYFEDGPDGGARCLSEPDGPLPTGFREWGRAMADRSRPLYAMAACAVIRWMAANGGRAGVLDAIDRAARGEAVDFRYSSSSASQ